MGLNRHTFIDESGGNLGAELSYYKWPSNSSDETIISDLCSESFGFGQKPEIKIRQKKYSGSCGAILACSVYGERETE